MAVLALLAGCRTASIPDLVQPTPIIPVERPRDDFSKRAILPDDVPETLIEEPVIYFPVAKESDG